MQFSFVDLTKSYISKVEVGVLASTWLSRGIIMYPTQVEMETNYKLVAQLLAAVGLKVPTSLEMQALPFDSR